MVFSNGSIKSKNTARSKGIRTAYQAVAGTVVAYFVGLWAIPEVQLYTTTFIKHEGLTTLLVVLASFGVGAGAISFLQNRYGK